jgi:hypothetical protein
LYSKTAQKTQKSTSSGLHGGCGQLLRGTFWEFWPISKAIIGINLKYQLRKQLSIFALLFD